MAHLRAREAGKARAVGRGIWSRVPFTKARKERLNQDAAEKAGAEERARLEAQAHAKDHAEGKAVSARPDIKTTQGEYVVKLRNELIDAITKGQSRTQVLAPDMMIRQVVCHDKFIDAIENRQVRTPIEEVNNEYSMDMVPRRKKLAEQLRMAKANSEYTISRLTTHDLDVIIVTMLGNTEIWKKETDWPAELPKPPEAFFRFLESVAMRKSAGNEGHYIGHVLKALATMRTFTGATMKATTKELVDVAHINGYLHRKSAESIDMVVAEFQHRLEAALSTPTDQMELETGVPGLGLVQRYNEAVRATGAARDAREILQAAHKEYDEAKGAFEQLKGIKRKADAKKDLPDDQRQKIEDAYKEARARVERAAGEFEGVKRNYDNLAQEAAQYSDVAHPHQVVQKLVDDFRALVLDVKESPNPEKISESIKGALPNGVVIDLLERTRTLLTENRESKRLANSKFGEFLERVESVMDDKEALIQMKQRFVEKFADQQSQREYERIMRNIEGLESDITGSKLPDDVKATLSGLMDNLGNMGYDNAKLQAKLSAIYLQENLLEVDKMIEEAPLPVETKAEMRKVFAAVKKKGSTDGLGEQIEGLRKAHAYPLRKVALLAAQNLDKPSKNNPVALDPKQRINARMIWEEESEDREDPPIKQKGWWARKFNWLDRRLSPTSDEAFYWLILKGIGRGFKSNLIDMKPSNFMQKTHSERLDDGTQVPSRFMRRGPSGFLRLTAKLYLIATMVVAIGWSPSVWNHYVAQSRWYRPWTWITPLQVPRPTIRRIHDSYDVPERLAGRGDRYYREYYGVGTKRLQSEGSDSGTRARLDWLRNHPDALRFFQERILTTERQLPMRVDNWRQLGETPETCGMLPGPAGSARQAPQPGQQPARPVPRSCENLNVRTTEAAQRYEPHDPDSWTGTQMVCCTIEVRRTPIADGLLLNTTSSDRFVDMLMAQERGGTQINYGYLSSTENRLRWVSEGFLVGPNEYDIIRNYKVENRDNIQFLLVQGSRATGRLAPIFERAHAPDFVEMANHDRFVSMWIGQARTLQGGEGNPAVDLLSDDIVSRSFDAAITEGRSARPQVVLDVTAEHQRWSALREVEPLNLQTDTAKDVVAAQQDIRQLLAQFLPSSASFAINLERSDEFVMVLDQHKRRGLSVSDFSPFSDPQGSRVQWAISMGYMRAREDFRPADIQSREGQGPQTAAVAPPQQDLGPAADRFFRSPNVGEFNTTVGNVIDAMFNRGSDREVMQRALDSRFQGSRENMDRAIRTHIYGMLTTRQAEMETNCGLRASGTGDQMQLQITNQSRVVPGLRNTIRQFAIRQR